MTVAELGERMTQAEFTDWCDFFALYPFDDFHRFHRPAALVSIGMAGGEIAERLEWLQPDPSMTGLSEVDRSILKAFTRSK